jgi:zinc protease
MPLSTGSAAKPQNRGGGFGVKISSSCIVFPAIAILSVGLHAQSPKAAPLPKAESILDRYVQVTGGKSAYEKQKTQILKGTIEFPAMGLKGKVTRYTAAPDREYSIIELDSIGNIETGIYMGAAWEKSVLLGPRIKNPEERDQSIREARFNAPLEWRKSYPQAATIGTTEIDGDECYEVVLMPATGKPVHQFYSKKTGLLVRTTMVAASQMGEVDVEVNVSDYKTFGGVRVPTVSRQKAGNQELKITVEDVLVNTDLPESRFDPPPDISAMIRKAKASEENRLP